MKISRLTQLLKTFLLVPLIVAVILPAAPVSAATSAEIREAQTILTKYRIPTGPIDGIFGAQTARGLCAFRYLVGETTSRDTLSSTLLSKLRAYNKTYSSITSIPARAVNGHSTYVVVEKKCQVLLYAESGRYQRVLAVSTGAPGYNTPNGSYSLGGTQRGWHCSTSYPEGCATQTQGRFTYISNYGNMYNKRFFRNSGYYLHGSTSVPTKPASHGCIRVTIADSDWMYDRVGNNGAPYMLVTNEY